MTNLATLDELKVHRDAALTEVHVLASMGVRHAKPTRSDDECENKSGDAIKALLLAERRLALAEACEALERKANDSDGRSIRLTSHMGYMSAAHFLRARLTPEETGR